MSDLIRLRKEYDAAVKRRHGKIGATGLEIRADALITALEAEVERAKFQSYNELRQRAEQAEADLAAKDEEKKTSDLCIKHLSLDNERLEAENERLRCCGNCGHNGGTKCCEPRLAGATGDLILTGTGRLSCRFTPSRWKEAER